MTFTKLQDYWDFHLAKNVEDRYFKTCYVTESAILYNQFKGRFVPAALVPHGINLERIFRYKHNYMFVMWNTRMLTLLCGLIRAFLSIEL